jgi:hypothetical protein
VAGPAATGTGWAAGGAAKARANTGAEACRAMFKTAEITLPAIVGKG